MSKEVEFVKWFSELSNEDVPIAGGKGASLAEMYNAKVPVPAGFVVTAQAYHYFLTHTKIHDEVHNLLKDLKVDDTAQLNKVSKEVREIIEKTPFPKEMEEEITEAYEILDAEDNGGEALDILEKSEAGHPFVAVRSSATTEDLADASFAGQQETFLNVRGKEALLEKAKKCMSSLFTPRAIFYRTKKGFDHEKSYLSVVVQKMINSVKSGVMFSQNPTKGDKSIVVEAVWGLGEGIVSGQIKPDHYEVDVDLDNFKINETSVSEKKIAIVRNKEGNNETVKLSDERSKQRVLDNYEIKRLAQYGRQLEEHYKKPQDIEFAIDDKGIFIVQSRPITTVFKEGAGEVEGEAILSGLGASPGISSGVVKIVHELSDLEKVQEGDVLVTEMTNPDMVVSMQKAAAIVTDEGGITSHAAIVSREMGIPAVVGTGNATSVVKDGDVITVDGSSGKIVSGKRETKLVEIEPVVETKTKIKVIADLPAGAKRAMKSGCKGIGLTRLEGIIATGGKHPLAFVREGKTSAYVQLLAKNLGEMIKDYEEMWIRSSDIRTDEYSNLEGAPPADESNPMMGMHGIRFALENKEILKAEFKAVKKVAEAFPDKKIGLMIPLVIRVEELQEAKKIMKEVGIGNNVKIGVMVETPAAVHIIDELCEEGLDFISFGTNDLTQFTLALDRNNEKVAKLYDETHPAIKREIAHVIRVCKKYDVETSICGQAGSRPDMAKFLVHEGISSISVNADAAKKISEIVAEIEKGEVSEGKIEVEENGEGSVGEVLVDDEPAKEDGLVEERHIDERPVDEEPSGKLNVEMLGESGDIEDEILKELGEDEYHPGDGGNGKKDIPPLNESIPVGNEMFQQMAQVSDEAVEEELVKESEEELVNEWKGEKRH